VYPSQSRRDFWQLKQMGLASSHLIRRLRHVMQPVFVRRLIALSRSANDILELFPWELAELTELVMVAVIGT
jgi:hypothetical protein